MLESTKVVCPNCKYEFPNNAGQGEERSEEHTKKSDDENGAVFGAIVLVASKRPESAR